MQHTESAQRDLESSSSGMVMHIDLIHTFVFGSKAVNGVISLSVGADETRESVGGEGGKEAAFSVNIANVDLHGSVVLGRDEATSGGAI
jgi:hypothetical protein